VDRLEAMSILRAAVETGSFSAASRRLRVPLPTVSRKVAELERHLKARLLVRSTRKLALTDAGADYLAACKRILKQVDEAEAAVAGEYSVPRGELAVTAPVVFGRLHVLPAVCDFLARFADIDVHLKLSDRNVNLIDDQIDVAVRIGALPDSSVSATKVGTVRRVVCGSPDILAAHGTPKQPEDLAGTPCVTVASAAGRAPWTFARGRGAARSVPVQERLSVNTVEAALDAALAGVGLTRVLSYQAARAVRDGKLRVVLQKFEPTPLPVSLMHAGGDPLPLKVRSFLDFAAPRLRKALGTLEGAL
jgi:DNA-binding transcriptional LysR family regulator